MTSDETVTVKGSPVRSLQKFIEADLTSGQRAVLLRSLPPEYADRFTSDAVKGIYRFFARVLTPPALLSKASHMWSSLYSQGQLRVEDQTESSARLVLSDFPSEPAFCARFTGWVERLAEMTGAENIRIEHARCASRGGACCEWKVTWT